jgi:DUF917 family protein
MKIRPDDIDCIAAGSAFLATGGGGDPYVGSLVAKRALSEFGDVELLDLNDLADSATVIAVGGIGAPVISLEKLPNGREQDWALQHLEQFLGVTVDALIAYEVGGVNSLLTFIAAARRGLPVLDGDGMGRALPEMQMTTFSIHGVNGTPMVVVDEHGNHAVVTTNDTNKAERITRNIALAMGGQCTSAESVMTGALVKRVSIPKSISLSMAIGRSLRMTVNNADEFIEELRGLIDDSVYGVIEKLLVGKVVDVERKTEGGFDYATIVVEDFEKERGQMRISVQNEFLFAEQNGTVRASVPDLICIVDSETATPITSDRIRYGQRVTVIAIGAPAICRTPEATAVIGPRAFGIDAEFVPLEQLTQPGT